MWGKRQAELLGAKCKKCPLRKAPVVLPPPVSQKATLAVVGEGPGGKEVTFGTFFAGPSGEFLDDCFAEAGFPRSEAHITNATLCYPQGYSDAAKDEAATHCRPRLIRELQRFRGRTILALGQTALETLTGRKPLKSWVGPPLKGLGAFERFTVFGAYHPAFVIRPDGADYKPTVFVHTARACAHARGKLKRWRWPKRIIRSNQEAVEALERILDERLEIGFDFENNPEKGIIMATGIACRDYAVCVPWHWYSNRHGKQRALETYGYGPEIKDLCRQILEHPDIPKVAHNAAHDIQVAESEGIIIPEDTVYDTLPVSHLVLPGIPHDLGFMMALETHAPRWKQEFHRTTKEKGVAAFTEKPFLDLRDYCGKDSLAALFLKDELELHVRDMPNGEALKQEYFDLAPIALKMQRVGFRRDTERMKWHWERLERRLKYSEKQIQEATALVGMDNINPNSSVQLSKLFFDRLGVRVKYYSDITGKPSLPEKALTELVTDDNDLVKHLARAVLRHRKVMALRKFVDVTKIGEDGISHVEQKPYGARTFRWSSSPNLMNIPKPVLAKRKKDRVLYIKEAGLRDTFIPHRDGDWMVCADYDQIELKIIACLADDLPLIKIFKEGGDPHRTAAADLFNIAPEEVSKDERDMAKIAQYEIWYGGSIETLWTHIVVEFPGYTLKRARDQHRNYCARHPVKRYHDSSRERAEQLKAIVAPLSGHWLYFYSRVEPNKVYNWPVQHTAADIINPAIKRVDKALNWKREALLTPVHDELVTCGPNPVRLARILKKCMERKIKINGHSLTYSVGIKMGPSWGEAEEVKGDLENGAKKIAAKYKGRLKL